MNRSLLSCVFLSLIACGIQDGASAAPPSSTTINQPHGSVRAGSATDRVALIAKVTKGFKLNRDKMEAVSFYSKEGTSLSGTQFGAYLSIPDGQPAFFRLSALYVGDSWIFYEKLKVMADDHVVYEKEFRRKDIVRDNSGGTVFESADYQASQSDLAAVEKIANAKVVTIRFSGRERYHDHNLRKRELDQLRATLKAYYELSPLKM